MHTLLQNSHSGLRNFALIDSNLPDLATLCAGLPSDCGIIWFDGALQGIDAIAQQFNQHAAIDRLHVITHGAPGKLFFGNTTLSQDTLADHAETIEQIRQSLSENAECYLYACELAQGAAGQAFVQALSEQIGLPIAAATHKVGHEELGGSWELDAAAIQMNGALAVSEWRGVLAAPVNGVYTFAKAIDNNDGTYTTSDGFFLISAVNGEYDTITDDLVVADEFGVYVNSGGGIYSGATNVPVGPASPTSYLEIKPAATGSFILNGAVIGEISNSTAVDDSDYTNIYVVGYANGVEVARTATHSSVGSLDDTYTFADGYFTPFIDKQIDTVRIYFDTPTNDFADRLTLINMNISGASTTPAPTVPLVNFNYTVGGDFFTINSSNGFAGELSLGNTTSIPNANVLFGAGIDDGTFTTVYQIGGSSGISNYNTQTDGKLEYLAINSYDAAFSLRQFKVYNDSGSNITLTITGHADAGVNDRGLAKNPAVATTTAVAVSGQWTTIDLPADFGEYKGFRIDSGSGAGTVPLYFNNFAIDVTPPPPLEFDLNGTEDGSNFSVAMSDTPVALADSDAVVSDTNAFVIFIDRTQIKAGDQLIFGDPTNGGATLDLSTLSTDSAAPTQVGYNGSVTIEALNDPDLDGVTGGTYAVVQIWSDLLTNTFLTTDMKFSGSVAGEREFKFIDFNTMQPVASSTVTVGAGGGGNAIVLDLDQNGDGSADTNNSTGIFDWDVPVYFADSATVLGNDAPAEYKKLTISFDISGWDSNTSPYLSVAPTVITSLDDEAGYLRLTRSDGYVKTFYSGEYGGTVDLKLTLAGPSDGARTLTIEKNGGGNLSKSDLNKFLEHVFFYESDSRFSETRVFSLKATAADDSETAVSTFSVTSAPDTTGPVFDYINYPDDGATALPINFFADSSISFDFDEDVTPVAGKILKLWKVVADGADEEIESIDVTNEDAVSVSGSTVYYTPTVANLANGARYYITIEAGAFKDGSDNPSSAYDGSSGWSFSTIAESLGTWNFVDTKPSTPDVVDPLSPSSSWYNASGNLEVTANGKYVLMSHEDAYKESIDYQSGLTVMKMNQDGSWTSVGEERFTSVTSRGLYDLVIKTDGATDTLYTLSASAGNTNATTANNSIRVHTFDGTDWVQVGANLADNIGSTAGNPAQIEQPPKGILVGDTLYVAYSYMDNGVAKLAVKASDISNPSAADWVQKGTTIEIGNTTKTGFDLIQKDGQVFLAVAYGMGDDSTSMQLETYKLNSGGTAWEPAAPDISATDAKISGSFYGELETSVKLVQDGNGILYAVYGWRDAGGMQNAVGVSKIDLSAQNPVWTHLPSPANSTKSLNLGLHEDLVFDGNNIPYLSLVDESGVLNVYRWEADNSAWRELDTGSSLDDLSVPSADLEIDNGVLKLLFSRFGTIQLAQFTPAANNDGGGEYSGPQFLNKLPI